MSYSPLPSGPFGDPSTGQGGSSLFARGSWQVPVVRVFGAPIFVHWSCAILVLLSSFFAWSSTVGLSDEWRILITIINPLFLLFSIFLHECSHAFAFNSFHSSVAGIYLYAMGGFTSALLPSYSTPCMRCSCSPSPSFRSGLISLAGPLINAVLGVLLLFPLLVDTLSSLLSLPAAALLRSLAYSQLFLAAYNMLPAPPLDGSQVLLAAFAACIPQPKATYVSLAVGLVLVTAAAVCASIWLSLMAGGMLAMSALYTLFQLIEICEKNKGPKPTITPTY